ncbi:hypothetical protein HDU98_007227 [Podochytrium sp. JEL0797]|nr:hypothetical protein HDU98_007227 [Podochytrium sp. JEL0797]
MKHVVLCAPVSPSDIVAVRNELARIEVANGVALLDDAAVLFGGHANWDQKSDFHAKAASQRTKKARDAELEVYGHLAFACTMEHPLLIIGAAARTYIHFAKVAYIIDEVHHGIACQFSIVLNTKQEFKFVCNSSAEYLHWIECLQKAYNVSHPFESNTDPDFDDHNSVVSHTSYYTTPAPRRIAPQIQQQQQTQQYRSTSRSKSQQRGISPAPMMMRQPPVMMESYSRTNQFYSLPTRPASAQPHRQQLQPQPMMKSTAPKYTRSVSATGYRTSTSRGPVTTPYYDDEFDYSHPPRGPPAIVPGMQKSKSMDRFRRSTRPTKLDMDDLYSDNDEDEDVEEGYTRSGSGVRGRGVPRSMSMPASQHQMQSGRSQSVPRGVLSPSKPAREMSVEEVYELTVNAYKAGLADDDGEENDRAVRSRERFGAGGRAGYPTRTGSVVRFSGEDEVAYDMQLQSDGSSAASRASSMQRRDEEMGQYEMEHEQQQQLLMRQMSRETSVPMTQRSKSVDVRFSDPDAIVVDPVQPRGEFEHEREMMGYTPGVSMMSRSVDPRMRAAPSVVSSTTSTTTTTSTKQKSSIKSPVYTLPGFGTSSKDTSDSLLEDSKTKRARESAERQVEHTAASSTKPVGNEKAKQFLLASLFGSGGKIPTIPSFGGSKKVEPSPPLSRDVSIAGPESKTTVTTTTTEIVSAPAVAAILEPVSNESRSESKIQESWTSRSYLSSAANASPSSPPSIVRIVESSSAASVVRTADSSSSAPPLQTTPPITYTQPPAPLQKTIPAISYDTTSLNNRSSLLSLSSAHAPTTMTLSPTIDLISTDMLTRMQDMRKKVEGAGGVVGTTASAMGFYDEQEERQHRGKGKRDEELEDSDSEAERGGSGVVKTVTTETVVQSVRDSSSPPPPTMPPPGFEAGFEYPVQPQQREVVSIPSRHSSAANKNINTGPGPIPPTTATVAANGINGGISSSTITSTTTTTTSTNDSSAAAILSPSPRRSSNTKMSANSAFLRESLMATLQSSPQYQTAAEKKTDRERILRATAALQQTLQKMEPVTLATVPPAVGKNGVIIGAEELAGKGGVKNAVGAFELLRVNSRGEGSVDEEEEEVPLQHRRRKN